MTMRYLKPIQSLLFMLLIVAVATAPLAAEGETVVEQRFKLKLVDDETDPATVDVLELSDLDELEVGQTRQEYTSTGKQVFITRESEDVYEFDIEGRIIRVGEEIEAPEGARIIKKRIEVSGEGSGENVWVDDKKHVIKIDGAGESGEKNIFVMKGGSGENVWIDDEHRVIELGEGGEKNIFVMKGGDAELHGAHGAGERHVIHLGGEGGERVIKIGDGEPVVIEGEGPRVLMIRKEGGAEGAEVIKLDASQIGEGMVFHTKNGETIDLHALLAEHGVGELEGLDLGELGGNIRVMVRTCDGEEECDEGGHHITMIRDQGVEGAEGETVEVEKVIVIEHESEEN